MSFFSSALNGGSGTRATRLLLEYDDERSGDFVPLKEVPDDQTVVLGLVTTKTRRAESAERMAGANRVRTSRSSGLR